MEWSDGRRKIAARTGAVTSASSARGDLASALFQRAAHIGAAAPPRRLGAIYRIERKRQTAATATSARWRERLLTGIFSLQAKTAGVGRLRKSASDPQLPVDFIRSSPSTNDYKTGNGGGVFVRRAHMRHSGESLD
jgi:hypothetical protein